MDVRSCATLSRSNRSMEEHSSALRRAWQLAAAKQGESVGTKRLPQAFIAVKPAWGTL
jgi:hypothetical protein